MGIMETQHHETTAPLRRCWLGRAILLAIEHAGITQLQAARGARMTNGALSHTISGARRASPETMRALTVSPAWIRTGDGVRVMIGHLRDEMQRAGMASDAIALYPRPSTHTDGSVRASLRILADHADDPDLAALLIDLAGIVSRAVQASAWEVDPQAAEDHAEYSGFAKRTTKTSQKRKRGADKNGGNEPKTN
jgi:hypothetical protein